MFSENFAFFAFRSLAKKARIFAKQKTKIIIRKFREKNNAKISGKNIAQLSQKNGHYAKKNTKISRKKCGIFNNKYKTFAK